MSNKGVVFYHGTNEWSAAYVDGKLLHVGDHDNVQHAVFEHLGVTQEYSNDFMCGGEHRNDVPDRLEDVELWTASSEERAKKAQRLRDQAQELLNEAKVLES